MRDVIFLGAGFSAPFEMPVMNSFFRRAAASPMLQPAEKQFLEAVLKFAYAGENVISIQRNNLEDVLSFLIMAEQLGIQPAEIRELAARCSMPSTEALLCQIVRRIYGPLDAQLAYEKLDSFKRLLGYVSGKPSEHELTLVTTNYDLIVETLMIQLHRRVRLPCDWLSTSGRPLETENGHSVYDINGKVDICKLHGSINWRSSNAVGEQDKFTVEPRLINVDVRASANMISIPMATTKSFHETASYVPVIVPPTLFKHQADKRFEPIWARAGQAIRNADRMLFVGFSFPESDTYMRYFLGAAMVENVRLTTIGILDPQAIEICKRLKEDSRYGRHFHGLLHPLPSRWEGERPWDVLK